MSLAKHIKEHEIIGVGESTPPEDMPRGIVFPDPPSEGDEFYRTDRKISYFYDGTKWIPQEGYSALDLYVSSTGSDSNDGFSAETPKATIQAAYDEIPYLYGGEVIIQILDNITHYDGAYFNRKIAKGDYFIRVRGGLYGDPVHTQEATYLYDWTVKARTSNTVGTISTSYMATFDSTPPPPNPAEGIPEWTSPMVGPLYITGDYGLILNGSNGFRVASLGPMYWHTYEQDGWWYGEWRRDITLKSGSAPLPQVGSALVYDPNVSIAPNNKILLGDIPNHTLSGTAHAESETSFYPVATNYQNCVISNGAENLRNMITITCLNNTGNYAPIEDSAFGVECDRVVFEGLHFKTTHANYFQGTYFFAFKDSKYCHIDSCSYAGDLDTSWMYCYFCLLDNSQLKVDNFAGRAIYYSNPNSIWSTFDGWFDVYNSSKLAFNGHLVGGCYNFDIANNSRLAPFTDSLQRYFVQSITPVCDNYIAEDVNGYIEAEDVMVYARVNSFVLNLPMCILKDGAADITKFSQIQNNTAYGFGDISIYNEKDNWVLLNATQTLNSKTLNAPVIKEWVNAITTDTQGYITDGVTMIDCSGGNVVYTLPPTPPTGSIIKVKRTDLDPGYVGNNAIVRGGKVGTVNSVTFQGSGLNDLTVAGDYKGPFTGLACIDIDSVGATDTMDMYFGNPYRELVPIDGTAQPITNVDGTVDYGLTATFAATTGHTRWDYWDIDVVKAEVIEDRFDYYLAQGEALTLVFDGGQWRKI